VIQLALLVAVHAQPAPMVTPTLPDPALAGTDALALASVDPHVSPSEKAFDGRLAAAPPGPTAVTRASYVTPGGGQVVTTELKATVIVFDASGVGFPSEYVSSGVELPTV
jgi:hypothetical protein